MIQNKTTPKDIRKMKENGEKIVMLTSYDYPTAKLLDKVGVDIILVGDSVGNTVLGYENTLPVTPDDIIHHAKAVSRGTESSMVVGDMPFLSYQISTNEAVKNAGRLIKKSKVEAVKLEGGGETIERVKKITESGIPVMGHLGLTPQKILKFGSYQARGKDPEEAQKIIEDAKKLEKAGAFSVILESIPYKLAKIIKNELNIPTIGIGAGPHCDGQVLVLHDILGLSDISPKFVKRYADLSSEIKEAVGKFREEVKSQKFPTIEHSYEMEEEVLEKLSKQKEKDSP